MEIIVAVCTIFAGIAFIIFIFLLIFDDIKDEKEIEKLKNENIRLKLKIARLQNTKPRGK